MNLIILVFVTIWICYCDAARILALVPFPTRSHWIVMEPLFQELANRGHQLIVFSAFHQKKPLPNYTDVDFSTQLNPQISSYSVDTIKERMNNPWTIVKFIYGIHTAVCLKVLEEPAFKNILRSKGKYDLVFTELFGSDCFTYFAYKLGIPLISFTTTVNKAWASERTGLPDNPSYIPNYLAEFSPQMTLWEKIYNLVFLLHAKYWHLHVYSKETQAIVEKAFGETLPPLSEVVANTSLVLLNSHFTLAQSRPFPPNVIEVAGIHIQKRQQVEEALQKILDNATNGVIIMSFGSVVRTSSITKTVILEFMKAFAKIPQTVVFKYEEELPEAPPNVIVRKWLPQRDMVEHENVVALITHGGVASIVEAVHFGIPIIGIPFFGDQRVNVRAVIRRGGGVLLALDGISEGKISEALTELLNNPKYARAMKLLSSQFRDRPQTPLQTAVYWTEYVIRHQGAPHLRPASVSLPLYQYLLLDVIAVLIGFIVVLVCTLYFITQLVSKVLTNLARLYWKKIIKKKQNWS